MVRTRPHDISVARDATLLDCDMVHFIRVTNDDSLDVGSGRRSPTLPALLVDGIQVDSAQSGQNALDSTSAGWGGSLIYSTVGDRGALGKPAIERHDHPVQLGRVYVTDVMLGEREHVPSSDGLDKLWHA